MGRLPLLLAAAACLAGFGLGHTALPRELFAVFDDGRGAGALLGAPGLPSVPPSWVFHYAWLFAGALCLAPFAAPAGRGALRLASRSRRELGDWWVVGVLGVASALAAAALGAFSLGGEGHTREEREYDFQARIFASGRLAAELPPTEEYVTPAGAGAGNFVVGPGEGAREGRWFAAVMPAWPLALAAGEALGQPWLLNPLIGLLTCFALYGWGRRLLGEDVALLAVLLFALSPLATFHHASLFAEPTFLLFLLLFLWSFDAGRASSRAAPLLASGLLLMLAFASRPFASLVAALPAAAFLVRDVVRRRASATALALFGAGLALGAAPLLLYNVATAGSAATFPWTFGGGKLLGVPAPALSAELIPVTTRRLWALATDLLGWPAVSLVPALIPIYLKKVPPRIKLPYAVAAATLVLFLLAGETGTGRGARHYYGLLPAALLGGAYGLTLLPARLRERRRLPAGTTAAAVLLAIAAGTAPYLASVEPIYRNYWGFPEGRRPWVTPQLEAAWEEWNVREAIVFVAPPGRCGGPAPNDPALRNRIVYARDRGRRNAEFAALFPPRPYLLCDYREFEKTGVLRVLELEGTAGEGE